MHLSHLIVGTVQPCVYWAKFAVVVGPKPYGGAARAAASVTGAVLCCVCCDIGCIELRRGVLGLIPDAVPVSYTARASSLRYRHDIW